MLHPPTARLDRRRLKCIFLGGLSATGRIALSVTDGPMRRAGWQVAAEVGDGRADVLGSQEALDAQGFRQEPLRAFIDAASSGSMVSAVRLRPAPNPGRT